MRIDGHAFGINTHYQRSRAGLETAMMRLASGDRHAKLGVESAASLSMSERLRGKIHAAEASTSALQTALSFVESADSDLDTMSMVLNRMMELAAAAADGTKVDAERKGLEIEFQALKAEMTATTRDSLFVDKQTIGRDTLVSFDGNTDRVQFWLLNGSEGGEIERDFGANAVDSLGQEIGFDKDEDFSMSRDGRSLYFLGTVAGDAAGELRVKRYDIENHVVYTGEDLFDTDDTLFVDESGDVTVNGSGTLYTIDQALSRTATAVTDMSGGTEYSVYKGGVTYHRNTDDRVVNYHLTTAATTTMTGPIAFGVGVDNTFSASGRYMADESVAGQIRVIDTRNGNIATLAVGAADSVNDLQFTEDGDSIYYINKTNNTIHSIDVETDVEGNVLMRDGMMVAQGRNGDSFNGLDLGGAHFGSITKFVVSEGALSTMSYEAADVRLYALGLANTHVDTLVDADQALVDIKEAVNRLNAQRAKVGAMGSRFSRTLESHRGFISQITDVESQIRDVDVASESVAFSTFQVRHQAAAAILAQFNTLSKNVLILLQQ